MLREDTGNLGEKIARSAYVQAGFLIVSANFFNRSGKRRGEIDFVARKGTTLVFVEVKTRTAGHRAYQSAVESVNYQKRLRLLRIIKWFLAANPSCIGYKLRIDVCVVVLDKTANYVRILSNAVEDLY